MRRYTFTLDLINDPAKIAEYEEIHKAIWPEIRESIIDAGILNMEMYRFENRMFMIMDVNDSFTFENKNKIDSEREIVHKWESFMWSFQQAVPGAKEDEKWVMMKKIFQL